MRFSFEEIPHFEDVVTYRSLSKGDLLFDKEGVPWLVDDTVGIVNDEKNNKVSVPMRQAVYRNDTNGNSWLKADGISCLHEYDTDELIPRYDRRDVILLINQSKQGDYTPRV